MTSMLVDVKPTDPATFATMILVFLAVAAMACSDAGAEGGGDGSEWGAVAGVVEPEHRDSIAHGIDRERSIAAFSSSVGSGRRAPARGPSGQPGEVAMPKSGRALHSVR